jgi:CRISPR-associated protein Cst2
VAGNQSRFLYDFSPDSVIFRWTDDFAPRFLYGFALDDERVVLREEVRHRIRAGDISGRELVVGGTLAVAPDGSVLKEQGATVFDGIKAAADELKKRIRADLSLK